MQNNNNNSSNTEIVVSQMSLFSHCYKGEYIIRRWFGFSDAPYHARASIVSNGRVDNWSKINEKLTRVNIRIDQSICHFSYWLMKHNRDIVVTHYIILHGISSVNRIRVMVKLISIQLRWPSVCARSTDNKW